MFFIIADQQIIVFYDGEWKIADGVQSYVPNSSRGLIVPRNITYAELVDSIYCLIKVDKFRHDLVLKVKYNVPDIQIYPPSVISEDSDVTFYLKELLTHRTPLCVSLVEKSLITQPILEGMSQLVNPTQEECIAEVVSQTDLFPMFQHKENFFESQDDILENQAGGEEVPCMRLNEAVLPEPGVGAAPTSYQILRIKNPIPMTLNCENSLEVSELFENKRELQLRLHKYSLASHFEFKVEKSRKDLWYVKCLDKKCKWRLRAVKGKFSELFEIRKFVKEHTCSIVTRIEGKRQAPAWVIGECVKGKYMDHHHDHMPKKIMEDMQRSYGIKMSYNKAWRSREKALMAVRGTVEDSYGRLPSYLYKLEMKNPGTITDIQTDEIGHFRYMFMSLGVSIRGFKSWCRPVLCVDASFLKHKIGGQLLVAIALDANEQLYPVAFGVVDSENNNS